MYEETTEGAPHQRFKLPPCAFAHALILMFGLILLREMVRKGELKAA